MFLFHGAIYKQHIPFLSCPVKTDKTFHSQGEDCNKPEAFPMGTVGGSCFCSSRAG